MNNTLKQPTQDLADDLDRLAHDADTLITATADMAGEHIHGARKRLAAMLGRGIEFRNHMRDQAVLGTRAADRAVHRNLYQIIAFGVGAGVVMGFLLATHNRCVCVHE